MAINDTVGEMPEEPEVQTMRVKRGSSIHTEFDVPQDELESTYFEEGEQVDEVEDEVKEDEAQEDDGEDEDDYAYEFEPYCSVQLQLQVPDGDRGDDGSPCRSPVLPSSKLSPNQRSFMPSVRLSHQDMNTLMICHSINEETDALTRDFHDRMRSSIEVVSFDSLELDTSPPSLSP